MKTLKISIFTVFVSLFAVLYSCKKNSDSQSNNTTTATADSVDIMLFSNNPQDMSMIISWSDASNSAQIGELFWNAYPTNCNSTANCIKVKGLRGNHTFKCVSYNSHW